MNARDAIALEGYRRDFRLNVDEVVAIVAVLLLAAGLFYGATHPQPPVASCYQSEPRK